MAFSDTEQATFNDIANRWKGLESWGLRQRKDVVAPGLNGPGDNKPWNLKYPYVAHRIERWDAFRDMWTHNPAGFKGDDDRILGLYQAAADVTVAEWAARQVSAPPAAAPGSSGYGPGYGYQVDDPWHPLVLPIITEALDRNCTYDGPMHVNVTPAAEQAVATLRGRWRDLFDWGARIKLPQDREYIDRWDLFTCKWNYNPSIGELNAAAGALSVVESDARDLGYKSDQPDSPPVSVPSIDSGTYTASAEKAVEAAVNKVADDIKTTLKVPWTTLGLVAGGALVVAGVVGWVTTREPHRARSVAAPSRREEDEDEPQIL